LKKTLLKSTMMLFAGTVILGAFSVPAFAARVPGSPLPLVVAPSLGAASTFGILGATTTVTDQTTVTGDFGSGGSTGTATVTGATDDANSAYTDAQTALLAALAQANGQTPTDTVTGTGTELGGQTLTPGVYRYSGAVNIGSDLTLDGSGIYIFQIQGALTTAANTAIILKGGADACQVFWVANVATLGAGSTFEGTLMSSSAITLGANSTTYGRILAETAVTADAANTQVTVPDCDSTTLPGGLPEVPAAGIFPLVGLAGLIAYRLRNKSRSTAKKG